MPKDQKNPIIGIKIDKLSKRFGGVQALDEVTLHVERGLLHGIIGPDGAGKTTLLRILDGLLHPTSGRVTYLADGNPVNFEELRPQVAYMPSSASLYPDLTVQEHLEFFRQLYQLDAAEFKRLSAELYGITRLDKFRDRPVGRLSGGMYKKAALMCALLRSPLVLLLDEPTNGVDPISRREFWELLYGLSEQNILILISTSYMDEAERCARVHLLNVGKVLESGKPEDILKREHAKSFDDLFLRGVNK